MLGLQFDPASVTIPAVDYSTARFMGVPLMPPFRIAVQPTKLQVCFPCEKHTTACSVIREGQVGAKPQLRAMSQKD